MLTEGTNFLSILFQLTLFSLLVILVVKLVKQYALPAIYSEIVEQKKHIKDLRNKRKLLDASKVRIEGQEKEQEEQFFILEKKMQLWHNFLLKKKDAQEKYNSSLLQDMEQKRKKQLSNYSLFKIQKVVAPQAVKGAYDKISKLYAGEKSLSLLKELVLRIDPVNK